MSKLDRYSPDHNRELELILRLSELSKVSWSPTLRAHAYALEALATELSSPRTKSGARSRVTRGKRTSSGSPDLN